MLLHSPQICTTNYTAIWQKCLKKLNLYQTLRENEAPHEQPLSALGFFNMWKAERINSDWKSIVAPSRYCIESLSTKILAPSRSTTLFSIKTVKNQRWFSQYLKYKPVVFIFCVQIKQVLKSRTSSSFYRYPKHFLWRLFVQFLQSLDTLIRHINRSRYVIRFKSIIQRW